MTPLLSVATRVVHSNQSSASCSTKQWVRTPRVAEKINETSAALSFKFLAGQKREEAHEKAVATPVSVNDAVRLVQFLSSHWADSEHGDVPVFVIDEFDQITAREVQEEFTNFVKQVSDKHVEARFIFCGIGESVEAIMAAHGSADCLTSALMG